MEAIQVDKLLSDENFVVMKLAVVMGLAQVSTEDRYMVAYRRKVVDGVRMHPLDSMVDTDKMKVVKISVFDMMQAKSEEDRLRIIATRIQEAKQELIKEHHLFDETNHDEKRKSVEVLERPEIRTGKAKEESKAVDVDQKPCAKYRPFTNEWFSGLFKRKK